MAEQAPRKHEHQSSPENQVARHEYKEKLAHNPEAGKDAEPKAKDSIESIRSSIEKEAAKTADRKHEQQADTDKDEGPGRIVIDREVKGKAYKKELHRVQSRLPKSQRSFSKFIHSPVMEAASEIGGKTVARPSGLLGGGIAAFVGTLALVLISRHYGFSYNFFVFILLLIGGFFVGLMAELVIRALAKPRS